MTQPVRPSRRRSRIADFKTPFVISLAVSAASSLGCGGKTGGADADGLDRDDGNETTGAQTAGGEGGGVIDPSGCTGSPPAVGSSALCPQTPACIDGEWVIPYVSCNPPPPPITECPVDAPEAGSSCAGYASNLVCEYAYCYTAKAPMVRCDAASAQWVSLPLPSCNPPAPEECPSQPPQAGSSCYSEGLGCSYGVCGDPGFWLECMNGAWSGNELPCPPASQDAGASDGGG